MHEKVLGNNKVLSPSGQRCFKCTVSLTLDLDAVCQEDQKIKPGVAAAALLSPFANAAFASSSLSLLFFGRLLCARYTVLSLSFRGLLGTKICKQAWRREKGKPLSHRRRSLREGNFALLCPIGTRRCTCYVWLTSGSDCV